MFVIAKDLFVFSIRACNDRQICEVDGLTCNLKPYRSLRKLKGALTAYFQLLKFEEAFHCFVLSSGLAMLLAL